MRSYTWLTLLLLLQVSDLHSQLVWQVPRDPEFRLGVSALKPVPVVKECTIPLHMQIARSYVGTIEATGNNDGQKIEYIIRRGKGTPHSPYCAYFVTLCIDSAKVKEPVVRSGLARNFKLKTSISAKDVVIGSVKVPDGSIIVWQKGETIKGHTGFVWKWGKESGITIEGNTSSGATGSQSDGDGIWMRQRNIEPLNYFRITSFTPVKY